MYPMRNHTISEASAEPMSTLRSRPPIPSDMAARASEPPSTRTWKSPYTPMPSTLPASSWLGRIVASRISTTREVFSSTTPMAIIEPEPISAPKRMVIIAIATPNAASSNASSCASPTILT